MLKKHKLGGRREKKKTIFSDDIYMKIVIPCGFHVFNVFEFLLGIPKKTRRRRRLNDVSTYDVQ